MYTGAVDNRNAIIMIMRNYAHAKSSRELLEKNSQEPPGHETIKVIFNSSVSFHPRLVRTLI